MTRQAGFTVLEVLVAMAITGAVIGAILELLKPAHGLHQMQPEVSDLQQRLRVTLDALRRDLQAAGAGTAQGRATASLIGARPPILPYRDGELRPDSALGVYYRPDAITILFVPSTTADAAVEEGVPLDDSALRVNARFNCGPLARDALCGFAAGVHAVVFDASGAWDAMTVTDQEASTISLRHRRRRPPNAYGAGAAIAQVELHTYYLEADARAGTYQLRHYDGFDTDLPMVDDVVGLRFEYFGDPQPPAIRPGALLSDPDRTGLVTTYGPEPPPVDVDRITDTWPQGENCTFAVVDGEHEPRLPVLAAGTHALVPLPPALLQDGPWCPGPENPDRFDADLLRIRRVRVTVRVQAASALLRGPAGPLFARGGSATSAYRLVPDQELRLDVTPRNLSAGR